MTNFIRLPLLAAVLVATAGCSVPLGLEDSGGGFDFCKNMSKTVASIVVSPATLTLTPGASSYINVTVKNNNGSELGICSPPGYWTSDNSSVAAVDGSELVAQVTGVANGQATLTISVGGKNAKVQVTVANPGATAGRLASVLRQ